MVRQFKNIAAFAAMQDLSDQFGTLCITGLILEIQQSFKFQISLITPGFQKCLNMLEF